MKIRTLKSSLSKAGFDYLPKRGKGSHSMWKYPFSNKKITISGKDNKQAKPYQIKAYERALAQVK
ncbi:MAG: type II toxin-antitoxin system HicA family toxin [Xenococcaceae cyanobacterium MO_188.B19]|nr:type II toxin-antitoxin system HicA family toxin [Xenococcaceae cyanobacterium MO_188.B19]